MSTIRETRLWLWMGLVVVLSTGIGYTYLHFIWFVVYTLGEELGLVPGNSIAGVFFWIFGAIVGVIAGFLLARRVWKGRSSGRRLVLIMMGLLAVVTVAEILFCLLAGCYCCFGGM